MGGGDENVFCLDIAAAETLYEYWDCGYNMDDLTSMKTLFLSPKYRYVSKKEVNKKSYVYYLSLV